MVKRSWRSLQGINPAIIAELFYTKLFTDKPSLRRMFPAEMEGQYKKLMDMLHYVVIKLDRFDELSEEIAAMAARHEGYGVKPAHYKLVGNALLWTLEKGIGRDWTPEVAEAWKQAYETLVASMLQEV